MNRFDPTTLHDCRCNGIGSGSELLIVEGESASKNVLRVRDEQFQAVLPMQGKPMNARKSSRQNIARNELFQKLISAIGAGWDEAFDLNQIRYDRIVLLFDPDADGIHCGALMLMFFHRWMPQLLETGRIESIRAPMYTIKAFRGDASDRGEQIDAYSEDHFHRLREHLQNHGVTVQSQRYRGLASIEASVLQETCVARSTRNSIGMSMEDAEMAIEIFYAEGKSSGDY